jgi:hypothetical protein
MVLLAIIDLFRKKREIIPDAVLIMPNQQRRNVFALITALSFSLSRKRIP